MTKKDFEAFARIIRSEYADAQELETKLVIERITRRWADVCANDNARFDRARFLAACGIEKENHR